MSSLKKLIFGAGILLLAPVAASATPVSINDNYVGGSPANSALVGQDVIGNSDLYDISRLTVETTATGFIVAIYSTYFNNVGSDGTRLGDLFLSTNGWNPAGTAPYLNDNFQNGEWMELVAVLSDHGEGTTGATNYLGHSGTLNLYNVNASNVIQSSGTGSFRNGQEVGYNPNGQSSIGGGTWTIEDVLGSEYDRLVFSFDFPAGIAFGNELGLHWAMNCGNDTIEGGASVPEPASVALLGTGLLAAARRRRKSA